MSWLNPGAAVLDGMFQWQRARVVGKVNIGEATKQRKRARERLWDIRNPGRRRGYDRGLLERVKRWKKANPEKVRETARRYAATEHGREMIRAKTARYKARRKLRDAA